MKQGSAVGMDFIRGPVEAVTAAREGRPSRVAHRFLHPRQRGGARHPPCRRQPRHLCDALDLRRPGADRLAARRAGRGGGLPRPPRAAAARPPVQGMRWGIVGTGADRRALRRRAAPGAGRQPRRRRLARAGAGRGLRRADRRAARVVADAAALAALDAVEVVYVTSPHHRHEADALAAIAAAKPVLCEKPLGARRRRRRPHRRGGPRGGSIRHGGALVALPAGLPRGLRGDRRGRDRRGAGGRGQLRGAGAVRSGQPVLGPRPGRRGAARPRRLSRRAGAGAARRPAAGAGRKRPGTTASTPRPASCSPTGRARAASSASRSKASAPTRWWCRAPPGAASSSSRSPALPPTGSGTLLPPAGAAASGRLAGLKEALKRQALLRRLDRGLMRGTRWFDGGLEHEIAEVERCLAAGLTRKPAGAARPVGPGAGDPRRDRGAGGPMSRLQAATGASASASTSSAMASEAVSPGLSMPKRLTRPASPCAAGPSIRKSVAGPPSG